MKIHIEKKLYLESDGVQYILKLYGKPNAKGEETFKALGYFGKIRSVINYLIKMKIHESTATNLNELLEDVKRIEDWVHDKVRV